MRTLTIRKGFKTEKDGRNRTSYSISGLTYGDLFRIRQSLLKTAAELDEQSKFLKRIGNEEMSKDFEIFAQEAREIAAITNKY